MLASRFLASNDILDPKEECQGLKQPHTGSENIEDTGSDSGTVSSFH